MVQPGDLDGRVRAGRSRAQTIGVSARGLFQPLGEDDTSSRWLTVPEIRPAVQRTRARFLRNSSHTLSRSQLWEQWKKFDAFETSNFVSLTLAYFQGKWKVGRRTCLAWGNHQRNKWIDFPIMDLAQFRRNWLYTFGNFKVISLVLQ